MDTSEWMGQIQREREEKDRFFAEHWQSPIPPEDQVNFKGLDYFPPEPSYRFELELHEYKEKTRIKIAYSKGEEKEFIRWGEFRFKVGDEQVTLQAYKSSSEEETLFVPFRDLTSGKETYGAGRYIDLNPERDRTPDGKWILDFNKAYNPWCVDSQMYTCPFVPPENWLKVPIRAGEKDYPLRNKKKK